MPSDEIIAIVKQITDQIHVQIQACNRSSDKSNHHFFKTMVFISQNAADAILAKTKYSYLERILKCSTKIQYYGAGNCQMQAFVALECLITEFLAARLSTYEQCVPISICSVSDHAFIIVDDVLVCDPWSNYVGTIANSPINLTNYDELFGIRSTWDCFDAGCFDYYSTEFTLDLVTELLNKSSLKVEQIKDENVVCMYLTKASSKFVDCDEIEENVSYMSGPK